MYISLFPLSQHFEKSNLYVRFIEKSNSYVRFIEKSNSHIANIPILTPDWSAGKSLFSQVTELDVLWITYKCKTKKKVF